MLKLRTDVLKDYVSNDIIPVIITYIDKTDDYPKHLELKLDVKTAELFLIEFNDATSNTRVERYVHDIKYSRGEFEGVYKNVSLKEKWFDNSDNQRKYDAAFEIKDLFMPNMRMNEKYKRGV